MQTKDIIPKYISKQILTIGLPYKKFKGGISMVINTYSKYFEYFYFISSYKRSKFYIIPVIYYCYACLKLVIFLSSNTNIKLVHIHGAAKGSFFRKYVFFLISKYLFGKQIIYHSHGSELKMFYESSSLWVKRLAKSFFENVDVVICLSVQWESFFTINFKIKKIVVLENIIEKPLKTPNKSSSSKTVNILFLGLIGDRKGIFDLLDVLAHHKSYFENKIMLTVGGRGETERLKAFIKKHDLNTIVKFEGWVVGNTKADLLAHSDIYILPSYNEGLPISILEAMSYNLPIISTIVGGIPEVVKDGVNGYLIKPGDKEAIFQTIKRFIDNKSSIDLMGQKSHEMVTPYYADVVIPKLNKIYEELLFND